MIPTKEYYKQIVKIINSKYNKTTDDVCRRMQIHSPIVVKFINILIKKDVIEKDNNGYLSIKNYEVVKCMKLL